MVLRPVSNDIEHDEFSRNTKYININIDRKYDVRHISNVARK